MAARSELTAVVVRLPRQQLKLAGFNERQRDAEIVESIQDGFTMIALFLHLQDRGG